MSVDFELDKGVAVITLNRPERLNAMDAEAYQALADAWVRVRDDPDVRVIVLTVLVVLTHVVGYLVVIAALVLLATSRRGEGEKYEGLRILR